MAALDPNSPPYGEHAEVQALQSAASNPQATMGTAGTDPAAPQGPDLSSLVGFGEPGTAGIPVTSGAAMGEGVGPSAIGLDFQRDREDANAIDPSLLNILIHQSMQPDATPSFRRWVRQVLTVRNG